MDKIKNIREKINLVDNEIVSLLNKRLNLSKEIINHKLQNDNQLNDISRENEIYKKSDNFENTHQIKNIYKHIFEVTKFPFLQKSKISDLLNFKPLIISGPCTIESEEQLDTIASQLSNMGINFLRGGAYKPRTNPDDFQGLGAEGIEILKKVTKKYKMYSVTELLDEYQLNDHYDDIDVLQIGSRNMTNFAFLKEIGKKTSIDKKPVILKRGFSATINEYINAAKYISNEGNDNIILALRGIRTFEQMDSNMRNTPDLASILELKDKTDYPVIFDPSHSTGNSKYVVDVSKAALELGADGLIVEVHNKPNNAIVDGFQSIYPDELKQIFSFL